jgi:transcriptional regulator with XRE-family HTH domain
MTFQRLRARTYQALQPKVGCQCFHARKYYAAMPHSRLWTFIDARLRSKGWKPADLSRASGVSESRLSAWRNQGTPPTIANARAVAEALGVSLVRVLAEAEMITDREARQPLAAYTIRELCVEITTRFDDLATLVPDVDVIEHTFESTSLLARVADRSDAEKLRDHQACPRVGRAESHDQAESATGA